VVQHHNLCDDMTLITVQDGAVVMRDGQVGTEQACCCGCECIDLTGPTRATVALDGPWVTGSPTYGAFGDYYSGVPASPAFLEDATDYYTAQPSNAGPADKVASLDIYLLCVGGSWFADVEYFIYGDYPDCPGTLGLPPEVLMQWYDLPVEVDPADCLPTGTLELGAADYVFARDADGNEIPSSGGNAPACFNLTLPDILFGRP